MKNIIKAAILAVLCAIPVLSAEVTASLLLAWDKDPTHDSTITFRLYQGTTTGVYSTNFDAGNQTEYLVSNLTTGTQYYFVVTALNAEGLESVPSNELAVTIPTAPEPSLLTLVEFNRNESRILMSWAESPPEELVFQYEINYKTDLDSVWTVIMTDKNLNVVIPTDKTSIYTVQVRAIGPSGPGPWLTRTVPGIVPRVVEKLYISPRGQITYTYKP